MDRGDWGAARSLLYRTRILLPGAHPRRAEVALELAHVLQETGELADALVVAGDAGASSNPVVRARAVLVELDVRDLLGEEPSATARDSRREEARVALERATDDVGLARYWYSRGYDEWAACRSAGALENWERGLRHAEAAGVEGLAREMKSRLLGCLTLGPVPVSQALERTEAILDQAAGSALMEAWALQALGIFRSMEGRIDEGRELVVRGRDTVRDAGHLVSAAGNSMRLAFIERRAGDPQAEERVLRKGLTELERLGDRAFSPTVALELAVCLYHQGRYDEVRALCAGARESTLSEDVANFIFLDVIEGALLARDGYLDEGESVTRRGLELSDATDLFQMRAHARSGLAAALAIAGKEEEAAATALEAIAIHDAKGDVSGSALLRLRFEAAGVDVA